MPISPNSFDGKTAFVTGGAGHLGQAFAKVMIEAGAQVVIADVDAARLEAVTLATGQAKNLHRVRLDVTDGESWQIAHAEARALAGPIQLLINNAGRPSAKRPTHEISVEAWDQLMSVNLRGVYLGIREFVPSFLLL